MTSNSGRPAPESGATAEAQERRRVTSSSPAAILAELPAAVALRRLPVPVLAVASDGAIVFANEAFCTMVGYPVEAVPRLRFQDLMPGAGVDDSALTVIRTHANRVVELMNEDGTTVRATMSASALVRGDDPIALVAFHDLTEQLWERG
jgi:PAS domain S-box-containing protein